ncbi:hypothetical protein VFPBJ_07019 [Purpureocillium lilacinum]|uniref:Uncharacterized protein n=1 Tax=Purpureocillium lilacinum TaxID=33203 RepID=A0A179GN45_PURLI|nr:hypothetical protein VFPBJ_07019 [Purpureocillium lilacinum]
MSWRDRSRPTKAHITISCVNTADSRVTTSAGICDPSPSRDGALQRPGWTAVGETGRRGGKNRAERERQTAWLAPAKVKQVEKRDPLVIYRLFPAAGCMCVRVC